MKILILEDEIRILAVQIITNERRREDVTVGAKITEEEKGIKIIEKGNGGKRTKPWWRN